MVVIIKDNEGKVVAEQKLSEKDCSIKVQQDKNGVKTYSIQQAVGSYH